MENKNDILVIDKEIQVPKYKWKFIFNDLIDEHCHICINPDIYIDTDKCDQKYQDDIQPSNVRIIEIHMRKDHNTLIMLIEFQSIFNNLSLIQSTSYRLFDFFSQKKYSKKLDSQIDHIFNLISSNARCSSCFNWNLNEDNECIGCKISQRFPKSKNPIKFGQYKQLECALCLENLDNNKKICYIEKCNHYYHLECISKIKKSECPTCKSHINFIVCKNLKFFMKDDDYDYDEDD